MSQSTQSPMPHPTRRRVFAGAGTVGALATVAAVLPVTPAPPQATAQPRPATDTTSGYQLTEHVRRYYQTAKV
ncbi:formate dehydrogenase [Sphaerotilus sp.]|uniref:formate dehydrogenase n=1 Tax=Sphaerotilus sp. TaxID=2093942 RepID=UPI0034E296BF